MENEPTVSRLNTWVELEMVLDNLCQHKVSKRNAIYRIGELMTYLPEEDKQEYLNWKEALKGQNEDKRRLGYFYM